MTVLPNPNDSPYADNIANNPLEFLSYDAPTYNIELLYEDDVTNGIDISYPGTDYQTIQARVSLDGYANNARRYTEIFDIDELYFWIKPSYGTQADYTQLQGPFYDRIQLGGREVNNIIPHNMWQDGPDTNHPNEPENIGEWDVRTGIEPNTYAGVNDNPHPWDDFYFYDFVSRIHKDDVIGDANKNERTDIPENARYNDGEYNIFCEVVSVKGVSTGNDDIPFTLDNFQPFLDGIGFVHNNTFRYYLNRKQLDYSGMNDGYLVNLHSYNDIAAMSNQPYELVVFVSEPMQSITVDYRLEGSPSWTNGGNMTLDISNPLRYTWQGSALADGCYEFRFQGQDKSNNPLMNIYQMTGQNSTYDLASIPVRMSATQWANEDADHATGYDYVNLCINASSCNFGNLIGKTTPSNSRSAVNCADLSNLYTSVYYDCSSDEYQIHLQGVPQGFDVGWAEGSNAYSFTGLMTYNTANPGLYCYIIGSDNPCCYTEGCVVVTGEEIPSFNFEYEFTNSIPSSTANLQITSPNPTSMALNVEIKLYDTNGNQVQSTTVQSLFGIPSLFTNLIIGDQYCVRYEDANGCREEYCFTVEGETCSSSIYFDEEVEIINERCDDGQGSITVTAFDASFNCLSSNLNFLWSNGDSDGYADGLSAGTYCVTLTANDGSCDDCIAVKCFEIENVCDPCDEPIQVDAWTGDICHSLIEHTDPESGPSYEELVVSYGWIFVEASGGEGSLNIIWTDGNESGWNRIITEPGIYCAEITDHCGNSSTRCWEIAIINTDRYCFTPYFPDFFEKGTFRMALDSIESKWGIFPQVIDYLDSVFFDNQFETSDSVNYKIGLKFKPDYIGEFTIIQSKTSKAQHSSIQENIKKSEENEKFVLNKVEGSSKVSLKAYPNPFGNNLTLKIKTDDTDIIDLIISNVTGQQMSRIKWNVEKGDNELDISQHIGQFQSGILLITVKTSNGEKETIKVIKMR